MPGCADCFGILASFDLCLHTDGLEVEFEALHVTLLASFEEEVSVHGDFTGRLIALLGWRAQT